MSNLQILSNSIRTFENLYSLNDLHQASGSENKHAPFRFIRLETTKELIAEIESDGQTQAVKVYRGSQGGTYVCEELVLSYAMWISPKFHLIVLRAFLAMHKAESQNANQIQPLADEQQELLSLLVRSYQFLFVAHDLREKVNPTVIGIDIEKHFSGYHLYNLGHPLRRHLDKIRNYIQDNAERVMIVESMQSLLTPTTTHKVAFK